MTWQSGCFHPLPAKEGGDTDPLIQVKLLRVLQTRQFQRLGDTQSLPFQGKVMAATHVDLLRAIREGRFREDFYYRLCADQIRTPTLREILTGQTEEIEYLLDFICRKFAGPEEGPVLALECRQWIRKHMPAGYDWPGNFRELEQCVRNLMIHGKYYPHGIVNEVEEDVLTAVRSGELDLEALISLVVNQEYAKTPSFAEVAYRLKVDPRTVKKYLK